MQTCAIILNIILYIILGLAGLGLLRILFFYFVRTKSHDKTLTIYRKRRYIKRKVKDIPCYIFSIIITIVILSNNMLKTEAEPAPPIKDTITKIRIEVESGTYSSDYLEYVDNLPFSMESCVSKDNTWDILLNENLHFNLFNSWTNSSGINDDLIYIYNDAICTKVMIPYNDLDELNSFCTSLYGSELLPKNNLTFEEIDSQIPEEKEGRSKVPPSVYIIEFTYRAPRVTSSSSFLKTFFAGRASGNAMIRLIEEGVANAKTILFYGAMSISYYENSIIHYEENNTIAYSEAEYNIAEVNMYLSKHLDKTGSKQQLHFLLCAQAHFRNVKQSFIPSEEYPTVYDAYPLLERYETEIEDILQNIYRFNNTDISES